MTAFTVVHVGLTWGRRTNTTGAMVVSAIYGGLATVGSVALAVTADHDEEAIALYSLAGLSLAATTSHIVSTIVLDRVDASRGSGSAHWTVAPSLLGRSAGLLLLGTF